LAGAPLEKAPGWVDALAILVLGAVGPLGAMRLRPARTTLLSAAALALFLVVAALAFKAGTIMAVAYPMLAAVAGAAGAYAVQLTAERRERSRQRGVFSRFVPENVVERAIERADG